MRIMWTVTCEMVRGVLEYYVENAETGERRGTFDCEPWAEEFAKELNKREQNDTNQSRIVKKQSTVY